MWIESEGLDKGSTVTFLVKLGICNNLLDTSAHQVALKGRVNHGSADLTRIKNGEATSSNPRYQRSL